MSATQTTSTQTNSKGLLFLSAEDHPDVEDLDTQPLNSDTLNVTPLWTIMHKMVPPFPNPRAVTTVWPYQTMSKALEAAAKTVTAEEAERRVLILVNQAMSPPYTTDTIYAGLQVVLPGETAPAHRHRAFALRFIIEGTKGFTAVDGEKIEMFPGDLILTPSWAWHDHGNEGKDPIVWLDGLDLPLWQFLPINFLEQYSEARYPSEPAEHSELRFPWAVVQQKLDEGDDKHKIFHYTRRDGSHLSKTISAQAEKVASGFTTAPSQEVFSFVYHVYQGEGYTTIRNAVDGSEKKVNWKAKDTFAVPAWSEVSHTSTSIEGNSYLFAINDRPIVEALTFISK